MVLYHSNILNIDPCFCWSRILERIFVLIFKAYFHNEKCRGRHYRSSYRTFISMQVKKEPILKPFQLVPWRSPLMASEDYPWKV